MMPLKPLVFEVLLALADEPRHGWSLVRDVEARLGGEMLLPGNFYRTLRRLLAEGLIEEVRGGRRPKGDKGEEGDDPRRRYFQLSAQGERVARAEARRLEALVSDRRVRKLLKAR
jgi:DNA-binding PadR family transcriptional regulator